MHLNIIAYSTPEKKNREQFRNVIHLIGQTKSSIIEKPPTIGCFTQF